MAKSLNPIPQTPIGDSFVWRDWFQRLSDKVFGTMSAQDASNVAITGGNITGTNLTNVNVTTSVITLSSIDGSPIGIRTPAAARFTSLTLLSPLPIASGGTNGVAVPTAGAVAYGTGTAYAFTLAGIAGQVLTSQAAGTPTWTTALTTGTSTSILYGNGTGGFSNVTIGTGVSFVAGTLSATGSGGTVTSVAALTLGTTGTDLSSTVANGSTTPVITLQVPTASATNRGALSSADWSTFNGKLSPFGSQTANYVYAAPNGSAGVPSFRALVAADLPVPALAFATGATYAVLAENYIVKVTYSGNVTTLLDATAVTGRIYYVNNASVGNVTVNTTSSQTINGVLTQTIPTGSTMQVYSDGSNWWIL